MRLYPRWLTPIDSYWWQADSPTSRAYIHYLFILDRAPDFGALMKRLEMIIYENPRFRSRIEHSPVTLMRPAWRIDPNFDLYGHVHHIGVPAPGNDAALRALISDLSSQPFAAERVPWDIYLIDGVRLSDSGDENPLTVLFGRLHHCIADGVALMQLMGRLIDQPSQSEPAPTTGAASSETNGRDSKFRQALQVANLPVSVARGGMAGVRMGAAAGKIILSHSDPVTELKQPLGVIKRLAWTSPLPLPEAKVVSRHFGATCNDLLLCLICGGLRRHLLTPGAASDVLEIRPYLPVNLRRPRDAANLGNGFGLVMPYLPLHIADPVDRLHAIHTQMTTLKRSPQAYATLYTMAAFGLLPQMAESAFLRYMQGRATLVITNLAGPMERSDLASASIEAMIIWAPAAAYMPLSVSIFSYANTICMGIQTDAGIISDPAALGDEIMAEWVQFQSLGATNDG